MSISNADIARALREYTDLIKLEDESAQSFRVRAYENAVNALRDLPGRAADMTEGELVAVKGVGKSIAKAIRELVDTGRIARLDELRQEYPPAFLELTRIPGLGPKTVKLLRRELQVEDVAGLRAAIEAEALRALPGLGAKTEEKVAKAIERLGMHGKDRRTPVAAALPIARRIVAALGDLPGVAAATYCGSLRRFSDTIGDIDVLVAAEEGGGVADTFVGLDAASEVLAHGEGKSSILTRDGLQVDLRVVPPDSFGAATLYFTGSKAHNIALRQRALDRGWTLNEYELADVDTGERIAAATEDEIYTALGMAFVPPELREDLGEIQAAAGDGLPELVTVDDVIGDLHVHTSLSGDGKHGLEKMLDAAADRGLRYVAITDHGEDLAINGVSREQMLRQRARIRKLQERYPDLAILHGCELNIGRDGSVDYDAEFLEGFDWCIASVHSLFDLDPAEQTDRLVAAMHHPAVNAIGHLSGRMIGRRPGIEFDVDAVLTAAEETGTAIEINGAIDRLDATVEVLRHARERDVLFVIDTDSHHVDEFRRVEWGVRHARRGWVERDRVANTWPPERFLEWVRSRPRR